VAPNSFFIDWIRYDGCFTLANAVRWSMTHAVCPTQPALEHFTWEELWSQPTLEDVFGRAGFECPTLREWVGHDRYDEYWQRIDQHRMYSLVKVPGLHVGGWFDHQGQYQQMDRSGGPTSRSAWLSFDLMPENRLASKADLSPDGLDKSGRVEGA